MQVTVEAIECLERRMTVELPNDQVKAAVDKRLREIARTVRIDGFRPGKVPISVVRRRYAGQVRQEILGDMVKSTFPEAISQEGLKPAGMPDIEPINLHTEEGLGYVATFEILPEVELNDITAEKIKRPVAEVTENDLSNMIDKLRKQRTTWNKVEKNASVGDQVTISFKGYLDGETEPFEGGSADALPLVLGSKSMIPGFEEDLVGAKAGESRSLNLKFPDDYRVEKLAGKPVTFKIEVSSVAEPVLPEIDESFAKAFGVNEGGVEAFRQEIRANMERELTDKVKNVVKEQVLEILLKANAVEAPKVMVKEEAKGLQEMAEANLKQSGQTTAIKLPITIFEEQAERRVKIGLIVAEIIKQQQFEPDAKLVRSRIEQIAESYAKPQDLINYYYSDKKNLAAIENTVLEDQVVDWVVSQVSVEESVSSLDEVMNTAVETS